MDETKLSSEALEEEAWKSAEDLQGVKNGEGEEFDELGGADDGVAGGAEGEFGGNKKRSQPIELPPIEAQSVTLDSVQFSETYLSSDFATSSQLLSDVPVDYDVLQPLEWPKNKDEVEVSELSTPLSVATESAQLHLHNQIQSSGCLTSSSNLSPTSVTESISSGSPAFPDQKLSPVTNTSDALFPEVEQQSSFKPFKPIRSSSINLVKTPSPDGFNWRKYGQKQVKVPQGSRSYYKCTYSDCHAKKIERNDHLNNVIEVISKGQHNHDPLPRTNCKHNHVLPDPPHIHQEGLLKESEPPLSSREPTQNALALPEPEQPNFSGSYEIVAVDVKEEHGDEPEPKRRLKKCNSACPGSQVKSSKKPKIVVHAAGDVGVSGDGYRWRKYGQKKVKGKPHPRNYYRCTSAGCPVRKYFERAVDDTDGFIITYKGVHDHDMPVPKKGQCSPSAPPLVAAAAEASMNSLEVETKDEAVDNQVPAIQWSVNTEGELASDAMDAGGEEAMESDRTLLGIGFEIKQC